VVIPVVAVPGLWSATESFRGNPSTTASFGAGGSRLSSTGDVLARGAVCAPFLANAKVRVHPHQSRACVMAVSVNGLTPAALAELAGLLMSTTSFEDLMQSVADLAGRAVPAASTCGITLSENGHVITVASADALARLLDEQQYELDTGPCLEALRTARVVTADDLSTETRWDGYPALAVAHGVRSVLSSPLLVNEQPIGALNLYAQTAHAFDEDSHMAAAQLTALAAATATAAMRHYDELTLTDHLRTALSSRSVIDQAIGIIIGMQRCPPGDGVRRAAHRVPEPEHPTAHHRRRPRRQDHQHRTIQLTPAGDAEL